MANFELFSIFLQTNNLTNKEVAEYLGVSPQYISQVRKGKSDLSGEKLDMLLNNNRGWDASMLSIEVDKELYGVAKNMASEMTNEEAYKTVMERLAESRKIIDDLKMQLDFLKRQMELKDEMIKYLMNGK